MIRASSKRRRDENRPFFRLMQSESGSRRRHRRQGRYRGRFRTLRLLLPWWFHDCKRGSENFRRIASVPCCAGFTILRDPFRRRRFRLVVVVIGNGESIGLPVPLIQRIWRAPSHSCSWIKPVVFNAIPEALSCRGGLCGCPVSSCNCSRLYFVCSGSTKDPINVYLGSWRVTDGESGERVEEGTKKCLRKVERLINLN